METRADCQDVSIHQKLFMPLCVKWMEINLSVYLTFRISHKRQRSQFRFTIWILYLLMMSSPSIRGRISISGHGNFSCFQVSSQDESLPLGFRGRFGYLGCPGGSIVYKTDWKVSAFWIQMHTGIQKQPAKSGFGRRSQMVIKPIWRHSDQSDSVGWKRPSAHFHCIFQKTWILASGKSQTPCLCHWISVWLWSEDLRQGGWIIGFVSHDTTPPIVQVDDAWTGLQGMHYLEGWIVSPFLITCHFFKPIVIGYFHHFTHYHFYGTDFLSGIFEVWSDQPPETFSGQGVWRQGVLPVINFGFCPCRLDTPAGQYVCPL